MTDTEHKINPTASHTPGPWVVTGNNMDAIVIETMAEMPEPDHAYGKQTIVGSSEWTFCRPQDADLIAAAPDLLEALDYWLFFIESEEERSDESALMVGKARTAIAKAKGEAA